MYATMKTAKIKKGIKLLFNEFFAVDSESSEIFFIFVVFVSSNRLHGVGSCDLLTTCGVACFVDVLASDANAAVEQELRVVFLKARVSVDARALLVCTEDEISSCFVSLFS